MSDIAERLRLLRGDTSQQKFGELVDLPQRKLSRMETGSSPLDLESTQKICKSLSVSADWLLFGKEPMKLDGVPSEMNSSTPAPMPQNDVYEKQIAGLWERIAVLKGEKFRLLEEVAESRKEVADARREVVEARQNVADIRKEAQDEIVKAYKEAQSRIDNAHKEAMEIVRDFALKGGAITTDAPASATSAPSTNLTSNE